MIRQTLKLLWIRKKNNGMLILDIAISFTIIFTISLTLISYLKKYQEPLGFSFNNIYALNVDFNSGQNHFETNKSLNQVNEYLRLIKEIEAVDGVESVSPAFPYPYLMHGFHMQLVRNDTKSPARLLMTSGKLDKVLDIKLAAGRWFNDGDNYGSYKPIVISKIVADELFREEDPIGKILEDPENTRVVGVVENFKILGELVDESPFFFYHEKLVAHNINAENDSTGQANQYGDPPQGILIRIKPGTSSDIEEKIFKTARNIAPDWRYEINLLENIRSKRLREQLVPYLVVMLIAAFMIIMTVFGMIGIFWLAVTRRTEEIGIRRAVGESASGIVKMIIRENIIVAMIGSTFAAVLCVQIPLLGQMPVSTVTVFSAAFIAYLIMIFLAFISGIYPALLASRIEPIEALRWE